MNAERWNRRKWIKGAVVYFGVVFGVGFLLGLVRMLWFVPRFGVRSSELMELPVMVVVTIVAASWVVGRIAVPYSRNDRLAMGFLALFFMIVAELGVATLVLREPISDVVGKRDPVAGAVYVCALGIFVLMPLLVGRKRTIESTRRLSIDAFIDRPDVSESHEILVNAPAEVVFAVAEHLDIRSISAVNAIFRLREIVLGTHPLPPRAPQSLIAETLSLGWGVLKFRTGRELVMGAVTQPWVGDVKFRSIPSESFSKFSEPGFVKIVWTIEVESIDPVLTRFRTQTRVLATDGASRRRFRVYWTLAGPFIVLIRRLVNRRVRYEAEARFRETARLSVV